jgi:hypothetical protein
LEYTEIPNVFFTPNQDVDVSRATKGIENATMVSKVTVATMLVTMAHCCNSVFNNALDSHRCNVFEQ